MCLPTPCQEYKKAFKSKQFDGDIKRMKGSDLEDVEDALHALMRKVRAKGTHINGPIMIAKAHELAVELGHPEFKCSNGWLSRFKTRKGFNFRHQGKSV